MTVDELKRQYIDIDEKYTLFISRDNADLNLTLFEYNTVLVTKKILEAYNHENVKDFIGNEIEVFLETYTKGGDADVATSSTQLESR